MSIFQLRNNEPCITAEGVYIPEMKAIWNRDGSDNKTTAQKELAYIYHIADPRSSYANLLEDEREAIVRLDYLNDLEPDKLVLEAIEKYKKLKETPALRALRSCENLLDKMGVFFDNVDLEETNIDKHGKKTYVNNVAQLSAALAKYEGVLSTIRKLKKEVQLEVQEVDEKRRGNVKMSILEDD